VNGKVRNLGVKSTGFLLPFCYPTPWYRMGRVLKTTCGKAIFASIFKLQMIRWHAEVRLQANYKTAALPRSL